MAEPLDAVLDVLCEDPSCCSERLLHTAGILYARQGFDSISTRRITSVAGVNLAAIAYYFGGKDGLQQAIIDHVVARSNEHIGRIFAELDMAIDGADGDRELLAEATRLEIPNPQREMQKLVRRGILYIHDGMCRAAT